VTKTSAVSAALFLSLVLVVATALTIAPGHDASSATSTATNPAFAELSDGRGGVNVEAIVYSEKMGFNKRRSLAARRLPIEAVQLRPRARANNRPRYSGRGSRT